MKIQRLKKVSFEEMRVRIEQRLAVQLERYGRSRLTKLGTDQELYAKLSCEHEIRSDRELLGMFRARTQPAFFAAFADRERTTEELRRRLPEAVPQITDEADAVVGARFNLLGFQDLSFGDPIDWHLEPVSGKRAPHIHWSRLNFLDADLAGDKKVVWELNRHQYFVTLGQAYWLTGDEKYARTFVNHLESWMDQNPPKLGINWASSLEVAFRSISWIWAFYFFKDSPSLEPKTFLRAWMFLYLNALHLETYLSTYFSPNTHLTGEALGLFYLGTLLPEFEEAARWRNRGAGILVEQLPRHVKPDGVYFEQSSYYHRYTTDFYTHFLILLRANGMPVPDLVESKLVALLDHLMYIQRPDGTTPLFGDDDGGKLLMVDPRRSNDFRGTLSTGAALFQRPDYKYVADGARLETLWLLGSDGLRALDQLEPHEPASQSVAFTEGGYYVMRDGWSRTSNYLWFDCGPHGMLNCGHAHADALSFEVAVRGRSILVDPGTYTYTGSKQERDWFRSSAAHNTLTIDRKSSSESAGPFSWKKIARCEGVNWITTELFDFVKGKHDGYSRLAQPAKHTRSILFLKNRYWIIRDQVSAAGEHQADLWFHFDGGAEPLIEALENNGTVVRTSSETEGLDISVFAGDGRWRREDGWVSKCYGERVPARVYVFSMSATGDMEVVTFLLPLSVASAKYVVSEIETVGGKAFEIRHENGLDIVMIRNAEAPQVETERLASDFEWSWASFSSREAAAVEQVEAAAPEQYLLIDGQRFAVNGQEILKTDERVDHVVSSKVRSLFGNPKSEIRNPN